MKESRPLAQRERAALELVISAAPTPAVRRLADQVPFVRVVGGRPTLLDLLVVEGAAPIDLAPGPLPVGAIVESSAGQPEEEIVVWTNSGYLSGLEHAWYTGEPPREFPPTDRIRVEDPSRGIG